MKRRIFLKNSLVAALPAFILPMLSKADDVCAYTYEGIYTHNGKEYEIHIHLKFDLKLVKKNHENKKLYVCVVKDGKTSKYPFIIKQSNGMKNFGAQKQHLIYIIAKYHEDDLYDEFKVSHSFILSKIKEVRIGFAVENNNYW